MKLNLVKIPDKFLRQKSKSVKEIDDTLKKLIEDMFETLYFEKGIGLSAIQIGIPLKIVVIDIEKEENKKTPLIFINPKIISYSEEKELMEEGCLSVPLHKDKILRSLFIKLKYNDINMEEKILTTDGLLAHCLQHEIDHTDGILYIDYLSKLKRDYIIKKSTKLEKSEK